MVKATNARHPSAWMLDYDAFTIAPLIVESAVARIDAEHDRTVCECCECHGHEYTVESAEPVGDTDAWVAVCDHCGFTAHPDDVMGDDE